MAAFRTDATDRVLIALTALALNAPSTYTIAWSKKQHAGQLPILWAGIATSAATVLGAMVSEYLMWAGLVGTVGLFGYAVFIYRPPEDGVTPAEQIAPAIQRVLLDAAREAGPCPPGSSSSAIAY